MAFALPLEGFDMSYKFKVVVYIYMLFAGISASLASPILSKEVTVRGHKLHYYQTGSHGRPLILLTGYATTSNFWNKDFLQCLANSHPVYLLDYRGIQTAESYINRMSMEDMANDVNAFVQYLKLKHAALVGWSMGGGVALQASFTAPSLYSKLYLLASIVPTTNKNVHLSRPKPITLKSDADIFNYVFTNNIYNFTGSAGDIEKLKNNFINPDTTKLFPNKIIIKGQRQSIQAWERAPKARQYFMNDKVAAIFYLPQQDKILNQKVIETITKQYPHSKNIILKNAGHAVHWVYTKKICQDIP